MLFLGIATPPVAGSYIADYLLYRRRGYDHAILERDAKVKLSTFVATTSRSAAYRPEGIGDVGRWCIDYLSRPSYKAWLCGEPAEASPRMAAS